MTYSYRSLIHIVAHSRQLRAKTSPASCLHTSLACQHVGKKVTVV